MTLPVSHAPSQTPATPDRGAPPGRRRDVPARTPTRLRNTLAALALGCAAIAGTLVVPPVITGSLLLAVATLFLTRRFVLTWRSTLVMLVVIVMFIPVRRYSLPVPLPFALEPYRVALLATIVAIALALWLDPRFVWRPVRFGWPIGIFLATVMVSISVNGTQLVEDSLAMTSVGALVNLSILLSMFYVVRQLLFDERRVVTLLQVLAVTGTFVGAMAIFERLSRTNYFERLNSILPLTAIRDPDQAFRAGGARSYASSQHPIALAVMLCVLIPIAIYLCTYSPWPRNLFHRKMFFGFCAVLMVGGMACAVSRTAVVTLAAAFLIVLVFRPFWACTLFLLSLPLGALGAVAVPKVFDELIGSFFDIDALVASQYTSAGETGAGRLADLGPAMEIVKVHPFFGTGFGGRIVTGDQRNAFILDNQWLGTLLDSGAVGVLGLAALMIVPLVMLLRFAFTSELPERYCHLAFTLGVSITSYVAALYFYDAFGFMQTFFVYSMLLAVGAWLLTDARADGTVLDDPSLRRAASGDANLGDDPARVPTS